MQLWPAFGTKELQQQQQQQQQTISNDVKVPSQTNIKQLISSKQQK